MAEKKSNPIKKIVTITLFVLLIASFGAWGIGDILQPSGRSFPVAEVGEVSISQQEFSRNLSQELNRLAPQFGGRLDIEQAQAFGVVQQVLDRLVNRALFEQHTSDLGLVVTKEQLRDQIANLQVFQDETGRFDRFRYEQALRSSGLSEEAFLIGLSGDIQRQQLTSAIAGAASTPRTLADALYRYSAETRAAETVLFTNESVSELPEPTGEQLQKYYDENPDRFLAPEYRKLDVLQIRPDDLTHEVAVSDERLREEYELRTGEFSEPELRAVSQVLYQSEEDAAAALAKTREGRSFEAVANETGAGDPISLGQLSRSDLSVQLPDLAESAFALEEGGVSEPVQSPLGWHLIQVSEIQPASITPFEEVAEQLRDDIKLRLATDTVVNLANEFDDAMAGGATLEETAAQLRLALETFERVDRSGNDDTGARIEALPDEQRFLSTAFSTEAGQESLLTETGDGGYFVVRVVEVIPAATKPLDAVREEAVAAWKAAERTRLLNEQAEALVEKINNGADFATLAEEAGLSVSATPDMRRFNTNPAEGIPLDLPSKLFELEQGKAASVPATTGVMVARLTRITAAPQDSAEQAIEALQSNLTGRIQNDLIAQYMAALNSRYRIDINNGSLDSVLAQF